MSVVWMNGQYLDESTAAVSLRDTGLLHAAGAFTTLRSFQGVPFRINAHLQRLRQSCDALFIPLTYKDDALQTAATELLQQNQLTDARLRLTVTRGSAINDPVHGLRISPNVFMTAAELEPYPAEFYQRGMTVILNDEQKLNPYDIQAGHKTLNYLSRLTALREANRRGGGEAIWFDVHNLLQSGSISNIFLVQDGAIITPPTNFELREPAVADKSRASRSAVLPGITRQAILELAQLAGVEVRLESVDVNQLLDADEVFLTNSVMQVMPICRIERKTVGNDQPGDVTLRLANLLAEVIKRETSQ